MTTPKTPAAGMSEEQWMAQPLHERAALLLEASEKLWEDDARLWPHADRCLKPTIAELRASLRPTAEDGLMAGSDTNMRESLVNWLRTRAVSIGLRYGYESLMKEYAAWLEKLPLSALSGRAGRAEVPRERLEEILKNMEQKKLEKADYGRIDWEEFGRIVRQAMLAAHRDSPR